MKKFALKTGIALIIAITAGLPAHAHTTEIPHSHPHEEINETATDQTAETALPKAPAGYINLGTLDVKPINLDGSATTNEEWFVEFLKPGQSVQRSLRISNFSPLPKHLSLYVTDETVSSQTASDTVNKNFYVKSVEENPDYLEKWVNLPARELTLKPGESKILSVNFRLPRNAGVGLHKGAVIIRETLNTSSSNITNLATEKGIRIYLNVVGPIVTRGEITQLKTADTTQAYSLKVKTYNSGTTDYQQTYTARLTNLLTGKQKNANAQTLVKPQTESATNIHLEKPSFGIYTLTLNAPGINNAGISTIVFIPFWIPLTILIFTVFVIARQLALNNSLIRENLHNTAEVLYHTVLNRMEKVLKQPWEMVHIKRGAIYLSLILIFTAVAVQTTTSDIKKVQAQAEIDSLQKEYRLTIKWGNFRNKPLPASYKKEWHGRVMVTNARMQIADLLHFERTDQAEVIGDNRTMRFDLSTGPENDGLILTIKADNSETPIILYENFDTGETLEFKVTDLLNSSAIFPSGLFSTQFSVEHGEQQLLLERSIELATMGELPSTLEIEATPPVGSQIPGLQNLFIEELPSTPEALTNFIFDSDYVGEISQMNDTNKVNTAPILIKALEATPEIIDEIAATPDLNFIFIPTNPVNFPPQEFSFNERKITIQYIGALIFVQNKETPWNTYIGTSDFQLLSGEGIIPASSLTITPGEPEVLTEKIKESKVKKAAEKQLTEEQPVEEQPVEEQTPARKTIKAEDKPAKSKNIQSGDTRKFVGKYDKSPLVNVIPDEGMKEIFILNPRLEVTIPEGTPAGTYRGTLTITSL